MFEKQALYCRAQRSVWCDCRQYRRVLREAGNRLTPELGLPPVQWYLAHKKRVARGQALQEQVARLEGVPTPQSIRTHRLVMIMIVIGDDDDDEGPQSPVVVD